MSDAVLYHYTTVASAHAIMQSRRVWLTDYRFLNDKHELKQGIAEFTAALPDDIRKSFDAAFFWHEFSNHHCILSLSKSPKILSQWRAYADDASGVALGLSEQFLRYRGIELMHCRYENHNQYVRGIVEKHAFLLNATHEAHKSILAGDDFADWVRSRRDAFYALIRDVLALKNPAFVEEQEVRAVLCVALGSAKTRVSRNLIVPYVSANFWEDDELQDSMHVVLREIWLGPKCDGLNRFGILAMNCGYFAKVEKYDCGYV